MQSLLNCTYILTSLLSFRLHAEAVSNYDNALRLDAINIIAVSDKFCPIIRSKFVFIGFESVKIIKIKLQVFRCFIPHVENAIV